MRSKTDRPGSLDTYFSGIRDLLPGDSICLVEWPEQGAGILPEPDLHIYLQTRDNGRQLRIEFSTPQGAQVLGCLTESCRQV